MSQDLHTLRMVEPPVVVHPATRHRIHDLGKVLQSLVVPVTAAFTRNTKRVLNQQLRHDFERWHPQIRTAADPGLERRIDPVCRTRVPNRARSELPGIELTTYGTQGVGPQPLPASRPDRPLHYCFRSLSNVYYSLRRACSPSYPRWPTQGSRSKLTRRKGPAPQHPVETVWPTADVRRVSVAVDTAFAVSPCLEPTA
jgi:hypothetical protein